MAYASADEFRGVWDTEMTDARLATWLDRASDVIDDLLGDVSGTKASTLRAVCIDMVHRADASPTAGMGVSSYSQGANGFSENIGYANPMGDLYLTKQEMMRLGIGARQVGFYVPYDQAELGAEDA